MKYILGIDECSTGSWAGPAYAAGVISNDLGLEDLDDSKKLSKEERMVLAKAIKDFTGLKYKIVSRSAQEIDQLGLANALKSMYNEIINDLYVDDTSVIIDGAIKSGIDKSPTFLVRGDSKIKQIMAASIIAKDARDSEMLELSKIYNKYNFENNAGYGTKDHMELLEKYGVCDIHRKSYKPIIKILERKNVLLP